MAEELHEEATNGHEHAQNDALPADAPVKLTPKALEVVKAMHAKDKLGAEVGLRIGVTGGGCSGSSMRSASIRTRKADIVTVLDGVKVFVDELSQPYIGGTTLDFVEGLHNAGFRFDNPRASHTCGCGSSFSA